MDEIESRNNLYRLGTDAVIGGTIKFAAPFQMLSTSILAGTGADYERNAYEAVVIGFLSKFPAFVTAYVQIISGRYAETIRRNTLLPEIRGKTTMALANEIRQESFGEIERALNVYAAVTTRLGIALANTSVTGSAITGALVGGGLDALATDGSDSIVGTFAGAVIGSMAANSAQSDIRAAQFAAAFESVRTITIFVASTPPRLLDAYVSYMFGGSTDFEARDREIAYAQEITSAIVNACLTTFGLVLTFGDKFTSSWLTGNRTFKRAGNEELIAKLYLGMPTFENCSRIVRPASPMKPAFLVSSKNYAQNFCRYAL